MAVTLDKRLLRPLPLDPAAFAAATEELSSAERGNLVLLALGWWATGAVPTRPADLGRLLRTEPANAKAMAERLAPHLGPGSYLGTLRAAHVAKARRRSRAGALGAQARWAGSVAA